MDSSLYKQLIEIDDRHWWFLSRRTITRHLLRRAKLPPKASCAVVDIGCGSGGNLALLAEFGTVYGCEYEENVLAVAKARGIGTLEHGYLPGHLPAFDGQRFHLATMFDVLEHVEHDRESLRVIYDRLAPGGYLFLTVPAYQWMMSHHDVLNHHFRRYSRSGLRARLQEAGFEVPFINYYNVMLFPPMLVVRMLERLRPPKNNKILGPGLLPAPLNRAIAAAMAGERFVMGAPMPFGASVIALAQKPARP